MEDVPLYEYNAQGEIVTSQLLKTTSDLSPNQKNYNYPPKKQKIGLRQRYRYRRDLGPPVDMVVYAVPLFFDSDCVFVALKPPLLPNEENRLSTRSKNKADKKWEEWEVASSSNPRGTKSKIVQYADRKMVEVPPEVRLLKNVPKNLNKVLIIHPSSLDPERVSQLFSTALNFGKYKAKKKFVGWLVGTILIAIAEAAAPFWPNILTVVGAIFVALNYKSVRGAKKLTQAVALPDRVFMQPNDDLDMWMGRTNSDKKVLDNQEIQLLCQHIGIPELAPQLSDLRDYKIQQQLKLYKKLKLAPPPDLQHINNL